MKHYLMTSVALMVAAGISLGGQRYEPTWESLVHYEAPEWYEDAKLGFWPIWGIFSVPAYEGDHAAEWYGRRMYQKMWQSQQNKGYAQHKYHKDNYGDPSEFGYKDFIPMWTGEKFDADEWADLCVEGGAKYFCTLAVFHDAFCLWDTKLSKWNSVNMGPRRDVVGELAAAMRKRGLRYGVSNHSAWNYMFFQWNHINGYDAVDPDTHDLYGDPNYPEEMKELYCIYGEKRGDWFRRARNPVTPSERDLNRWIERTRELADLYQPDLYYFDWGMNPPVFESRRMEFGAHYYNKALEWGRGDFGKPGVVINYKSRAFANGAAVRDFERGAYDHIADKVWQTDDSIYYGSNWSYDPKSPIKSADFLIDQLMDTISKRGVLMLAFGPKADGSFPENQKKLIRDMGAWLKINGEAVYATRPYEVYGEVGPHWYERDEKYHQKMEATTGDIRFTRNKANTVLYATLLKWPGNKAVLKTFRGVDLKGIKSVRMLGTTDELSWKQTAAGMEIELTGKPPYGMAYPVRIEFGCTIPSPTAAD